MVSCVKVEPGLIGLAPQQCQRRARARLELGRLLGAATLLIRLVLHGPQGPQGGDLGLGQAADAPNSEPLVGSSGLKARDSTMSLCSCQVRCKVSPAWRHTRTSPRLLPASQPATARRLIC